MGLTYPSMRRVVTASLAALVLFAGCASDADHPSTDPAATGR